MMIDVPSKAQRAISHHTHMRKIRMAQVPNDINISFHYNGKLGITAIVPKSPHDPI